MSTKYKNTKDVPLDVIINRLEELSNAITKGKESVSNEFTMRVPAECDRDADLVLAEAAKRLEANKATIDKLVEALEEATDSIEEYHQICCSEYSNDDVPVYRALINSVKEKK